MARVSKVNPSPLTLCYTVTGTAEAGSDYKQLSGRVTIPANASGIQSSETDVFPIDDSLKEGLETVVVTLKEDPTYQLGTAKSVTLNIVDND